MEAPRAPARGDPQLAVARLGAVVSEGAQRHCACAVRAYEALLEATGLLSAEDKRRKAFERAHRALLVDGSVFQLLDVERAADKQGGLLSKVSQSALALLGSSSGDATAARPLGIDEGLGSPIMVQLHLGGSERAGARAGGADSAGASARSTVRLSWASLEQMQQRPKHSGVLALHRVQLADKADRGSAHSLVLRDAHGKVLLAIATDEAQLRDRWLAALQEALVVLAPEMDECAEESRGLLGQQERYLDLEQRRREREDKKRALGQVGMAFTAQAMANRA
jgi:hypothetical protein